MTIKVFPTDFTHIATVTTSVEILADNGVNNGFVTVGDIIGLVVSGTGISVNTGTVALANIAASTLLGNASTVSAAPQAVTIGTGLSLSSLGTLTATAATAVTSVVAGSGLNGGTITSTGTISLGTIAASSLMGNSAVSAGVPGAIAVGSGLTLTVGGTLSANLTLEGLTDLNVTSVADGDRLHWDNGTSKWKNGREPYVLAAYIPSTMSASQCVLFHKFAGKATFPANFGTATNGEASYSESLVAATASTVLDIYSCPSATDPTVSGNWTAVGTITYSAAGHAGAFASTGGTTVVFNQGDKIKILGPSSADATLANINITLAGDR